MARMLIGYVGLFFSLNALSTETFYVSGSNRIQVPFDRIELESQDLQNPLRPIEVKLWKDNRLFAIKGRFVMRDQDPERDTLVLSHRDKSEEILIFFSPQKKQLLRAVYRRNETIREAWQNFWAFMIRVMLPTEAVATTAVAAQN